MQATRSSKYNFIYFGCMGQTLKVRCSCKFPVAGALQISVTRDVGPARRHTCAANVKGSTVDEPRSFDPTFPGSKALVRKRLALSNDDPSQCHTGCNQQALLRSDRAHAMLSIAGSRKCARADVARAGAVGCAICRLCVVGCGVVGLRVVCERVSAPVRVVL